MDAEPFDVNEVGLRITPPEDDFGDDRTPMRDWWSTEEPLADIYTLPAQGLDELEKDRFGFHVVNADASSGFDLNTALGQATLLVDGHNFNPDHLIHQLDVMSKGGTEPVRVVFRNIGAIKHDFVHELEHFFEKEKGYPIKSIYFMDEGKSVDEALRGKILMRCDEMVDAATLLDAASFGWGSKNPYDGKAVGSETVNAILGPDFTEAANLAIERDNLLLEMTYNTREKKFVRLGLDPAARGNEVDNSAGMFFKSLRKRGVTPEEMLDTTSGAKTFRGEPRSHYPGPPPPPPPNTPFLTEEDWLGLKRGDKIWCVAHGEKGEVWVLRYQVISNNAKPGKTDIYAYSMQNLGKRNIPFHPNLWHIWEKKK